MIPPLHKLPWIWVVQVKRYELEHVRLAAAPARAISNPAIYGTLVGARGGVDSCISSAGLPGMTNMLSPKSAAAADVQHETGPFFTLPPCRKERLSSRFCFNCQINLSQINELDKRADHKGMALCSEARLARMVLAVLIHWSEIMLLKREGDRGKWSLDVILWAIFIRIMVTLYNRKIFPLMRKLWFVWWCPLKVKCPPSQSHLSKLFENILQSLGD